MTQRWARNRVGHKSRAIVGVAGGSSRTQGRGKSSETTQVKDTRWALQRQQDQSKAHVIEGFVVDPSTDSQVKLVVHHLARPQHVIHVNMSFTSTCHSRCKTSTCHSRPYTSHVTRISLYRESLSQVSQACYTQET